MSHLRVIREEMEALAIQLTWLFILALPVSCIAWTVTHAELFREPREYFTKRSKNGKSFAERKFFFLLICEYCFSHYVTILFLFLTHYKLLFDDWKGYVISGFSLVWVSNFYMSFFTRLRLKLKIEKLETLKKEEEHNSKM